MSPIPLAASSPSQGWLRDPAPTVSSPGRVHRRVEPARLLPAPLSSALHHVPSITEGRWATTASADSCPITPRVTPYGAALGDSFFLELASLGSLAAWRRPAHAPPGLGQPVARPALDSQEITNPADREVGQVSPDKDVNFRCTAAPFTLPLNPWASLCGASSPQG